jgi:hypothetical protein
VKLPKKTPNDFDSFAGFLSDDCIGMSFSSFLKYFLTAVGTSEDWCLLYSKGMIVSRV